MNLGRMPLYIVIMVLGISCLFMLACKDGGDNSPDAMAQPAGSSLPVADDPHQETEEGDVYIVPITEAEEASFSCGEWGFGMEIQDSDLPMVQCILDKSDGKEGRADLLRGLMVGAIWGSSFEATQLLLDEGVDAGGAGPGGETLLLHALNHLTFVVHDDRQASEAANLVAIVEILVDEGARVPDSPTEGYVNAWFIAAEGSPDGIRIMSRAGMDANIRRPLDERFDINTALVGAVRRGCRGDDSGPQSPEVQIVRELINAGADVNTMSIGQILDDKAEQVIGLFESETVLSIAEDSDCTLISGLLQDAGACRNLEGRRVEWDSGTDFVGILKFLSAPSAFPSRGDIDCVSST